MNNLKWTYLFFLYVLIGCTENNDTNALMIGDRIDGPANVRDTINGKQILFSLDDNLVVECTEAVNDWLIVGYYIKLNNIQYEKFKLEPGDTLYNTNGRKIGITISETDVWMGNEKGSVKYGLITGYTYKKNIKPESVIENVLAKLINDSRNNVTLDDLNPLIKSFQLEKCSSNSMGNEKGEWYFTSENSIDDPSPQDRITLIIEKKLLVGIVHSRVIHFENFKTYNLINGHKFTPIAKLSETRTNEIIKERIKWYNSVD